MDVVLGPCVFSQGFAKYDMGSKKETAALEAIQGGIYLSGAVYSRIYGTRQPGWLWTGGWFWTIFQHLCIVSVQRIHNEVIVS